MTTTRLAYVTDASGARATVAALYSSEEEAWEDAEGRGECNAGYVVIAGSACVGDRLWIVAADIQPRPDLAAAAGAR